MTRLNTNSTTISGPLTPKSATSAADDEMFASSESEQNRTAWLEIIDHKLIDWGLKYGEVDEDGIIWPSRQSVSSACELANGMADNGKPTPTKVVPNGDGGIVFERKEGSFFETIEIFEDGSKEYCQFVNSNLRRRVAL